MNFDIIIFAINGVLRRCMHMILNQLVCICLAEIVPHNQTSILKVNSERVSQVIQGVIDLWPLRKQYFEVLTAIHPGCVNRILTIYA